MLQIYRPARATSNDESCHLENPAGAPRLPFAHASDCVILARKRTLEIAPVVPAAKAGFEYLDQKETQEVASFSAGVRLKEGAAFRLLSD